MLIGKQVGRYKIRSPLGKGGMGEVFLAEDTELERLVALKILPANLSRDGDRVRRFIQEAKATSALNHPNILTIYEIGRVDDFHFIASEFVRGETLRERLKSQSAGVLESLEISIQIAAALEAAHQAGIIHRDIKPENVMVRDDRLVKVLDFGLAKLTQNSSQNIESEGQTRPHIKTNPGIVMGTMAYMSPEQARGKDVDSRTDIWSLGVCLYEMIGGRPPFAGETQSDIIAAILMTETLPLSDLGREVPFELERIIFKALVKDREERYQTAQELLFDLKQLNKQLETQEEFASGEISGKHQTKQIADEAPTQILYPRRTSSIEYVVSGIKQRKGSFTIALIFLLLSAAVAGYWFFTARPPSSDADFAQIESIAVLPFVNTVNDADAEYLSDGVTESLINSLSQIPRLTVKARSSVFRYKNKEIEPQKIGSELSVQAILSGRIVQRGDGLLLSLELVDARTGNHLWGEQYNRKITDLVKLQSEIAGDVSNKLRTKLSGADAQRVTKSYTDNSEAYQLYLKGRYYLNKRSPESFEKAIRNFQQAIDLEPNYALVYAGLSDCYTEMSYWSFGNPKETMPKARAAAQKALELDETLAEGHTALATVAEDYDWNFSEAEKEYTRAIELNPNYAHAFRQYGKFLCEQKRFGEAYQKLDKAAELDPLSLSVEMSKGSCLYQEKQYDRAIGQMQKIITADPTFLPAQSLLGAIYLRKGMNDEVVKAWLNNSPLENYSAEDVTAWKLAFETSGIQGFLKKDIELRKEAAKTGRNQSLFIAMQYANLGDNEQALIWLERAFEERHNWLGELQAEPAWDNLRGDPRFKDLMRRVGFAGQ